MAENDARLKRAQDYLILRDESGCQDPLIWEHVRRVAHCALALTHLPQLRTHTMDPAALELAALFHDAGWVHQYRQGQCPRLAVLSRPTSDLQRELSVSVMSEVVRGLEPPGVLERAARILRACNAPQPAETEAILLVEADRLDEIGPLALLRQWRRFVAQGKGITDVIKTWGQQQEYRFWEARLSEFQFEVTRELARQRLVVLEPMMQALARHHRGEDITQALESLPPDPAGGFPMSLPELGWPGAAP